MSRPVKSETPKDEKEVGSDLFGVTKPRPNFVSESDHREELDFELGETVQLKIYYLFKSII